MRRLILFKASDDELERYQEITGTEIGDSFYRVANAGSVPSLIDTIAEHHDSTGKAAPEPGYRLTETVPEDRNSFRDNGWEVVRVEEYTPEIPVAEFNSICICYCVYRPLAPEDAWIKKAHRIAPSLASFDDEPAYEAWLATQTEDVQRESRAVTAWMKTQEASQAES